MKYKYYKLSADILPNQGEAKYLPYLGETEYYQIIQNNSDYNIDGYYYDYFRYEWRPLIHGDKFLNRHKNNLVPVTLDEVENYVMMMELRR